MFLIESLSLAFIGKNKLYKAIESKYRLAILKLYV